MPASALGSPVDTVPSSRRSVAAAGTLIYCPFRKQEYGRCCTLEVYVKAGMHDEVPARA